MKPLVLHHAACPDGFCAAWCARQSLGEDCDFLPVQYGQGPPEVAGRTVYVLDFSYKRPVMAKVIADAYAVCVLDHHKTAQADLDFPSCSAQAFRTGEGRVHICFDMEKSGGRLAWEFFFPGRPAPWLVDYTEDRDLWRFRLPDSREVSAALRSYPFDFAVWDDLLRRGAASLVPEGKAILRYQEAVIDQAVKNAREQEVGGHRVLCVNSTVLFSEIAGKLAKGRPFGACWFERADGKRVYSLRSAPDGIDVSAVAKAAGGGGHKHAAGFEE